MADLVRCKECNQEIAKGVKKCPHCGKDQRNFFMKHKILTAVLAIILIAIIGTALGGDDASNTNEKNTNLTDNTKDKDTNTTNKDANQDNSKDIVTDAPTVTQAPEDDFTDVVTEYTLTSGYYTAGIDLPSGKCNLEAVEGKGNVSSSNIFDGGINEMFGVDDGEGYYTESFNGLKMDENVVLSISGGVTVKLVYTKVSGRYTGREFDEANKIELTNGNYVAGDDFPEGIYNMKATSGNGNVSSSNILDGGINEMVGVDDSSGFYIQTFQNLLLDENVELNISGGVTIELTPMK